MKKYLFLLIAILSSLTAFAQSGVAFFVYRNDGGFNTFFYSEVDSITYSTLDVDGIEQNEVVTQEVWTKDSIYRIPVAVIDSVGFVQPETVYKNDIKLLTKDLFEYVISAEDTILTLSSQTPAMLLPSIGEKLVAVELSDTFPYGFLGRVLSLSDTDSGYRVVCEPIGIEEAVDKLCVATKAVIGEEEALGRDMQRRAKWEYAREYKYVIGEKKASFDLSGTIAKKDVLTYSGKAGVELSVDPTVTVNMLYVFDTKRGLYVKGHIVGDTKGYVKLDIAGEVSKDLWKKEFFSKDWPLAYGFTFYVETGGKVEASGELAVGATFSAQARQTLDITYCPNNASMNSVAFTPELVSSDVDWDYVAARASLKACAYLDLGIGYAHHKLAKVGGEFDLGAKGEYETILDLELLRKADKETHYYEQAQEINSIDVNVYLGAYFNAALMSGAESVLDSTALERLKFKKGRDWNLTPRPIFQGRYLPIFEDTDFRRTSTKSALASATVSGDCVLPSRVGFALLDKEGQRVKTYYRDGNYWNHYLSDRELQNEFGILDNNKTYTIYPIVNWLGFEILAQPSKKIVHFPVTLSDFKVTKSQYKKGAFTHEGNKYDYRFDVSVTASLDEDAEDIADWGYMYQDPFGNLPAKISMKGFGYSYTDTRYAYFRNENPSTCTLYGYVIYVGSDEPVFGEPSDFPLIHNDEIKVFTGNSTASYEEAQCWGSASLNDDPNAIHSVADECGFFYNLSGVPQNGNAIKQSCNMSSDGLFDATLSGLTEDTQYYYTAFVRVGEDYHYGVPETFKTKKKVPDPEPIAITGGHYNETATTATIECTYNNVPDNADCGYYISKSYYDNASRSNRISAGIEWDKVSVGRYEGLKTINLDGLMPDEEYQYYAYISVGDEDVAIGTTNSFTTKTPIANITGEAQTSITSATVGYGFENVPEGGTCQLILLKVGDPLQNAQYISVPSTSNGNYTFAGLEASTSYQYMARIEYKTRKWDSGTGSFTTQAMPTPVVITGGHYNETLNSATIECTYEQIPAGTDCGYYLRGQKGSTLISSISKSLGNVEGTKTINLSDLKAGTTYYYQAYAQYQGREYLGSEKSFQTLTPNAVTGPYSNVTSNKASIVCGYYNVPSGATTGVKLSYNGETHEMPYNYGEGEHNIDINGLYPGTSYAYSAYLKYEDETYEGDTKQFTTLTPSAYVGNATNVEEKTAQFEYGFSNVPEGGTCHIALQQDGGETYDYPASDVEQDLFQLSGLQPSTTYTYWAYVDYYGEKWNSNTGSFTTKTPPTPVATTGECSGVTKNSATVSCTYENVPEGGICGVEYTWNGGSTKQVVGSSNGTQSITLNGLKPGTSYTYCAYIEANGQTYYGGDKTFTTKTPSMAGNWSCTVTRSNGGIETWSITLTEDGKGSANRTDSSSAEYEASWGVNSEGLAYVQLAYVVSTPWRYSYQTYDFFGTVDNIQDPSHLEGDGRYTVGNDIAESSNNLTFNMTK